MAISDGCSEAIRQEAVGPDGIPAEPRSIALPNFFVIVQKQSLNNRQPYCLEGLL